MHSLALSPEQHLPPDPWHPTLRDLEAMAQQLVGASESGWLRPPGHSVLIANRKRGGVAASLADELAELSRQTGSILKEVTLSSRLRAAAFFHLRFENLHPLRDGNGRVGRVLMCAQCAVSYGVRLEEILRALEDYRFKYRDAFRAPTPELQFELLLDVLGLLLGVEIPPLAAQLPFSLDPKFIDPTPLPPALRPASALPV